jgi:hypothetical protein
MPKAFANLRPGLRAAARYPGNESGIATNPERVAESVSCNACVCELFQSSLFRP